MSAGLAVAALWLSSTGRINAVPSPMSHNVRNRAANQPGNPNDFAHRCVGADRGISSTARS